MISSTSRGVGGGQVLGRRVPGEQRRRHHVHPHVGGLGRQDRGRQQLERVAVVELADRASGYSSASRRATSRARPFGVRGRAIGGAGYGRRPRAAVPVASPAVRRLEIKRQMAPADIAAVVAAARRRRARPTATAPLDDHQLARPGRRAAARASPASWPGSRGTTTRSPTPRCRGATTRGRSSSSSTPHHRDDAGDDRRRAARRRRRRRGRRGRRPRPLVGARADRPPTTTWPRAVGLRAGPRRCYQMRRPLPIGDAVDARRPGRSSPGQDEEAWLAVNNRAFALAPRAGRLDLDTLAAREKRAVVRPRRASCSTSATAGWPAFCWTKVHADHDPVLGEIYVIAVDPDFHGLGPRPGARRSPASTTSPARGIAVGMLYVDADNTAARRPVRAPRLHGPPHRPGLHRRRAAAMTATRHPLRRSTATSSAELLAGEPRYRVDQVWHGPVRAAGRARPRLTDLPEGAARPARRRAARRRSTVVTEQTSDDGDTVKWLWAAGTTARRSRPC